VESTGAGYGLMTTRSWPRSVGEYKARGDFMAIQGKLMVGDAGSWSEGM
jgi:hypothetical protein